MSCRATKNHDPRKKGRCCSMSEKKMIPFYPEEVYGILEALEDSLKYFYDGPDRELEDDLMEAIYRIETVLKERG